LDVSLGPHTARIRSAIEGGGWCPKSLIDSQSEEYLQINFLNLTVITLIETQGRHGPFQVRRMKRKKKKFHLNNFTFRKIMLIIIVLNIVGIQLIHG
jgi:hypothetical protein